MKKILIIEDCQSALSDIVNCLYIAGYETIVPRTPNNSKEVHEITLLLEPDLIIVDLANKNTNGKEICKSLTQYDETSHIPVIIITAIPDIENKLECFQNGAADCICKPFDKEEIMARIKALLKLYDHKKHLMETIKTKEKQISILAHDVRNLFNGVFGMLGILEDNYDSFDDDERKKYITYAKSSSEKLFRFMDKIIDWALVNSGFRAIKPEVISLADFVESIISLMSNISENKNIELKNKINKDIIIISDKVVLSTVLRNLLYNAVKFTHEYGKVILTAEFIKETILIHVSDTGSGIDNDIVDKIMAGTSVVPTPGTNSEKGHGFGLVFCKELLEKCGGKLSVTSTLGKGSKFSFSLPFQI